MQRKMPIPTLYAAPVRGMPCTWTWPRTRFMTGASNTPLNSLEHPQTTNPPALIPPVCITRYVCGLYARSGKSARLKMAMPTVEPRIKMRYIGPDKHGFFSDHRGNRGFCEGPAASTGPNLATTAR